MPEVANPGVGRLQDSAGNGIDSALLSTSLPATARGLDVNGLILLNDIPSSTLIPAKNARSTSAGDTGVSVLDVHPMHYNGTSFDPRQNNREGTLLASAARTASVAGATQVNYDRSGVMLFLNITVASGTGGLQVQLQGADPVSGSFANLIGFPAAIIAAGLYVFEYRPGSAAAVAGSVSVRSQQALPRTWRAFVTHGDASGYTYSLGYSLLG